MTLQLVQTNTVAVVITADITYLYDADGAIIIVMLAAY